MSVVEPLYTLGNVTRVAEAHTPTAAIDPAAGHATRRASTDRTPRGIRSVVQDSRPCAPRARESEGEDEQRRCDAHLYTGFAGCDDRLFTRPADCNDYLYIRSADCNDYIYTRSADRNGPLYMRPIERG